MMPVAAAVSTTLKIHNDIETEIIIEGSFDSGALSHRLLRKLWRVGNFSLLCKISVSNFLDN